MQQVHDFFFVELVLSAKHLGGYLGACLLNMYTVVCTSIHSPWHSLCFVAIFSSTEALQLHKVGWLLPVPNNLYLVPKVLLRSGLLLGHYTL